MRFVHPFIIVFLISTGSVVRVSTAADQNLDWSPIPFEASYRVRYEGVPFSVTGTRTLRRTEEGDWEFASEVSAVLVSLAEQTRFAQEPDGTLRADQYEERRSGMIGDRVLVATFDWIVPRVIRTGHRPQEHEFEGQLHDPVTWQIALQRDLTLGGYEEGEVFSYAVSNGSEPQQYRMVVRGVEAVSVPAGTFDAVLIEREHAPDDDRETRIWLAPAENFQMVRFEHVDDRKVTLELEDMALGQDP